MLLSLVRRYDQIPYLHQLREILRRWWNIEVLYIDKEDHPIFLTGQPEGLCNRLCALCLRSKAARQRCEASILRARHETRELGARVDGLLTYSCHLRMTNIAVPIIIEGRDGGMIYTSGFFDHGRDEDDLERLATAAAEIAGGPVEDEVLSTPPILLAEDLERLMDILQLGVSTIVTMNAELRAKETEIETLRTRLKERQGFAGLVGSSQAMQEVYRLVERVAANDCTVLVRGESGTGKELVAGAVHGLSERGSGPFVVQNCSAFNDNLLESELFGHVRGAFTGAIADKKGLFEIANGGVLFLDEVAEMSPALQAKLLRVLQDHSFWPVGSTTPRHSDVRIVAATHRDLEALVRDGAFREDLYYRLNVISIVMPPLRERRSDIPALAEHFLQRHGGATLSAEALRVLCDHDWPGNVRELANELERMTVLSDGARLLDRELVSPRIREATAGREHLPHGNLRAALSSLETRMIRAALEECAGNRSHAAKLLGIARSNLIVKLKTFGLG